MSSQPGHSREQFSTQADLESKLSRLPAGTGRDGDLRRASLLIDLAKSQLALRPDTVGPIAYIAEAAELFEASSTTQRPAALARVSQANLLLTRAKDYDAVLELTDALTVRLRELDLHDKAAEVQMLRLRALEKLHRWPQLFDEAQGIVISSAPTTPSIEERRARADAHWAMSAAARRVSRLELALPGVDTAIKLARSLPSDSDRTHPRGRLLRAMLDRPVVLELLGRRRDARAAYRDFIVEFGDDTSAGAEQGKRLAERRRLQLLVGRRLTVSQPDP